MGLAELSGVVPLVSLVLRRLGRPRCAHRAALRLRGHDRVGVDLRRRAAAGALGHRRGRDQGGAGRAGGGRRRRAAWSTTWWTDDVAAIALARRYLSHFPTNAWEAPPAARTGPTPGPGGVDLLALIPPDPRPPLSRSARCSRHWSTTASCSTSSPASARSIVTALAHLGGRSVAIVANDPARAGRHHRRRRRRQGGPLPRRGRRLRPALHLPGRQPRGAGRHGRRGPGHPPPRGPALRRPAPDARAQAPRHPAQGVRIRLVGDGHEPLRRPDRHPGPARRSPSVRCRRRRRPAASTTPTSGPGWRPSSRRPRCGPPPASPTTTWSTPATCATRSLAGLDLAEGRDTGARRRPGRSASCPDRPDAGPPPDSDGPGLQAQHVG